MIAGQGDTFVPEGPSAWELGTGKDPKKKANADYQKRTTDPKDVDTRSTTFVFVTPRRWAEKDDWISDRKQEDVWKDVRVYDADSLETWLETAPGVHIWLSRRLGKSPDGATDLLSYWKEWCEATNPATNEDLLLAGRGSLVEHVHAWLKTKGDQLSLLGETQDEVIASFAASLQLLDDLERDAEYARAVVVGDLVSWDRIVASGGCLTVIRAFDANPESLVRARKRGHAVVLPLTHVVPTAHAFEIPRLRTDEAAEALKAMGIPRDRAGSLAAIGRRGFQSLRRNLAATAGFETPAWAAPSEGLALCPALLAGTWDDTNQLDRDALARVSNGSYEALTSTLIRWWNEPDSPLRQVADRWILTSREDAWSLLANFVSRDLIQRFHDIARDVLSKPSPRFARSKEERWIPRLPDEDSQHSGLFRTGLAETLVLMGSRDVQLGYSERSSAPAKRLVSEVLASANQDWRVWATLSPILSLLAEAAPSEFLQATRRGIEPDNGPLLQLLTEEEDHLFGSAPHTGLLWALETLAWSTEHLGQVTLLLGHLAEGDPGGRLANRPASSLRSFFLIWFPQTSAGLDERLNAIDLLRLQHPASAWTLMRDIIPGVHESSTSNPRPRCREWAPEQDIRVSRSEITKSVSAVIARMLEDARFDGTRWADLVEALPRIHPEAHLQVRSCLQDLPTDELPSGDGARIWHALRELVSKHRSFPDAAWSLPTEHVEPLAELMPRFEPVEHGHRYAWLFNHRPALPEGREGDYQEHQRAVRQAQENALQDVCGDSDYEDLIRFTGSVVLPETVGAVAGGMNLLATCEVAFLKEHLNLDGTPTSRMALAYGAARAREHGLEWLDTTIAASDWDATQKAALLSCLPIGIETFKTVETHGGDAEAGYWKAFGPYGYLHEDEADKAARKLIQFGRPRAAATVLGSVGRREKAGDAELIANALEEALVSDEAIKLDGHEVGELLDLLAESDLDRSRVAGLEWQLLPALRSERKPRVLHDELSMNSRMFVQVVELVYRSPEMEQSDVSEADAARARHGYDLLESWRGVPSANDEGTVDSAALMSWIQDAREALESTGRQAIGDQVIGKVLSGCGSGADGAWPIEAVRDAIEEVASEDFESGIQIGKYNSRGLHFRNPKGGGDAERGLAEQFAGYARTVRGRWPRTAAMLDRMADSYRAEARREDQESELREDLGH